MTTDKKTHPILAIFVFLIALAIVYMVFAFSCWDLDCRNWPDPNRFLTALIGLPLAIGCAYPAYQPDEN